MFLGDSEDTTSNGSNGLDAIIDIEHILRTELGNAKTDFNIISKPSTKECTKSEMYQ